MSNQGLFITDPETGEERFVYYSELEDEVVQTFIKPIGGFIFPAGLFVMKKLPPAPFYLKDWLPKRGKALLYAPAKSGKSYLCLQLARCIGAGEPFLGIPTTQGKVLYIQFELGEEILQHRMREETKKDYENVYVGTTFSMKLDMTSGQKMLWRALEAVEPSVLILDPKYKMIIGDENESTDMKKVTDFLDTVIEGFAESECSVLIIDHTGKDITKRGRGSTVFEDWVDSYIQMTRKSKKGEPLRVEIEPIFLRHASLPPEPIKAELGTDFEFFVMGDKVGVKEQVEATSKELGEFCPKDLFDAKIGANTSVFKAIGELVEEGKIKKEGKGKYVWIKN